MRMELLIFFLLGTLVWNVAAADFSILDRAGNVGNPSKSGCPVTCFRADPVCGKNGVTYWCGSRDAACEGVEVAHTGYCTGNGGSSKAGQALLVVHLVWLIMGGVIVLLGIP